MQNYQLLKSIISEPWAIIPEAAENAAFLIEGLLNPHLAVESDSKAQYQPSSHNSGAVAVVNIIGELTKYDPECGPGRGMVSYGQKISDLASDPSISAIVLNIDSPGGMVSGTQELAAIIKSIDKPIIAFVSDLAASAAYWIASSCDEIIANNELAEVGSVGVLATFSDFSEYYKKQGVKLNTLYARQSTHKNETTRELLKGNTSLAIDTLSTYADAFISAVISNRPSILEEQLSGKVFFAKDVLGSMVDSIGNIESAITRANELSNNALTNSNQNNSQMSEKTKLNAVLGVDELASQEGGVFLNEEQLDRIEAALPAPVAVGATEETHDAPEAQEDPAPDPLAEANARIATLETDNAQMRARLANRPAEQPAAVSPKTDAPIAGATIPDSNPYGAICAAEAEVRKYS